MTTSYNCTGDIQRSEGLAHAQRAISEQQCVVIPTDTVYGIAADAFSAQAVATLLAAKGRGRNMPPPVLIPRIQTMDGLAIDVPVEARRLAEAFWPGALTLIFHAQPSLSWDLGETFGTVALRMPDDPLALDLLMLTGPLAVSSANRTGQEAATTAADAQSQLAESVAVYLDDGKRPVDGTSDVAPSTIVDATGEQLRVVRHGAVSLTDLRATVPTIADTDGSSGQETNDDDGGEPGHTDSGDPDGGEPGDSGDSGEQADVPERPAAGAP